MRGPLISTLATLPLSLSAPANPENVVPALGTAAIETALPTANWAAHVPGQLIPAGDVVVDIEPLPECTIVRGYVPAVNVAETFVAPVTVTVHDPTPVHPPLQPEKTESLAGVAVSVTVVPEV